MIGIVCTMNPETGELYFSGWNKGNNPLWHLQKLRLDTDDKEMKFIRQVIVGYIEGYRKMPKTIQELKGDAGLKLFFEQCFETRNTIFPDKEQMFLKDVKEIEGQEKFLKEVKDSE